MGKNNITKKLNYKEALLNYFSDIFFITAGILIYRYILYYKKFLLESVQKEILLFAFIYVIIAFPYYLFIKFGSFSRGAQIILGLLDFIKQWGMYFKKKKTSLPSFSKEFRVCILFMLVKFFYIPLMLNFATLHIVNIEKAIIDNLHKKPFYDILYLMIIDLMYLIDTGLYCVGYLVESTYLDSEVKSVESTLSGWAFTLMCYPPFNIITNYIFPWPQMDPVIFENPFLTFLFRFFILFLTGVYVWASIALGPKCSNLTNRGIVNAGPYAFVRHPAYISKNLSWWLMISSINIYTIVSMSGWLFIYYMRAITEERHLSKDPDYIEYCKKVPWLFIPYLI